MTNALIPPDRKRCQAEKPNGATAFSLGGVPKLIRCTEKPVVIAYENEPYNGKKQGSMSLCQKCSEVFVKQMGSCYATFEPIAKKKKRKSSAPAGSRAGRS
jgi:hypothetical protein